MQQYHIKRSSLSGSIIAPASKSHSLRAILFASLAKGKSYISNVLPSPDSEAMINACLQLGAGIEREQDHLLISGVAAKPQVPKSIIDAGNSGQVLRFIAAVASCLKAEVVIGGDASICSNRPVKPYIESLPQLGVECISVNNNDHAPIKVKGPMRAGRIKIDGRDSQPVSGLLIAATLVPGTVIIEVDNPGELPWLALTLAWFDRLGIVYDNEHYARFVVPHNPVIDAFDYEVAGDFSSIAFPLVAAIITNSRITIHAIDMDDPQGDKALIECLIAMGAKIEINHTKKSITVMPGSSLQGRKINVNNFIDAITILAVVGCYAKGTTHIYGAAIARAKESDRIAAIVCELRKMGADIIEQDDGLIVKRSILHAAVVESYYDHRVAMSLAVAAMGVEDVTTIANTECVAKSYPNFTEHMGSLGASIEVVE